MSRDYDHLFKLLIIGDSGKWVGEVVDLKFCVDFFFLCVCCCPIGILKVMTCMVYASTIIVNIPDPLGMWKFPIVIFYQHKTQLMLRDNSVQSGLRLVITMNQPARTVYTLIVFVWMQMGFFYSLVKFHFSIDF